jgi:hypothetical protein
MIARYKVKTAAAPAIVRRVRDLIRRDPEALHDGIEFVI